jgi:hypothetical protein
MTFTSFLLQKTYKLAHGIVSSHFALHTENLTYDLYIIFYYRRRNNSPMAFVSSRSYTFTLFFITEDVTTHPWPLFPPVLH